MDLATSSTDDLILIGTDWVVRVWHGGRVHPATGVKGGLLEWADPPPMQSPEPVPRPLDGPLCAHCLTPLIGPPWLLRRIRHCSKRCAGLARHTSRDTGLQFGQTSL